MKLRSFLSDKGKDYFFIMHLSYEGEERKRLWNYAKDNNIIGLSHSYVSNDWAKVRKTTRNLIGRRWVMQFNTFCGMQKGDVIMILNGQDSVLGIAIVDKSSYRYEEDPNDVFFDHTRSVEWKIEFEYEHRRKLPRLLYGFSNTLLRVPRSSPRWSMLTNIDL